MAEVVNRNASLKMTALLRIIGFRMVKKNTGFKQNLGNTPFAFTGCGLGLYHGLSAECCGQLALVAQPPVRLKTTNAVTYSLLLLENCLGQ
jgi:ABC-type arginine transport system permease subunit